MTKRKLSQYLDFDEVKTLVFKKVWREFVQTKRNLLYFNVDDCGPFKGTYFKEHRLNCTTLPQFNYRLTISHTGKTTTLTFYYEGAILGIKKL